MGPFSECQLLVLASTEYDSPMGTPMLKIILLNAFLVGICVVIHYEFLYRCSNWTALSGDASSKTAGRFRILIGVLVALTAHVIEIWVFGLGYYTALNIEGLGNLAGNFSGTLMDCVYFSFTNYTTLGFGDIEPSGYLRFLAGIESLTGFVLITWTASFLFLEMQRHWVRNDSED